MSSPDMFTQPVIDMIIEHSDNQKELQMNMMRAASVFPTGSKVYVAGPMRGIPEFNFPAFHAAADMLRQIGCTVFNPAAKDNERHGTDISKGNAAGCEEIAAKQHGFNLREALGLDLAWICAEADAVALLPGWQKSKGATAEKATAEALGLLVVEL